MQSGWLTVIAWIATLAVGMIFVGTIIQGVAILDNPGYTNKEWHGTLLSWAVVGVAVFINTVVAGLLPFLEGMILFLHIMGFVAIMISLIYLSDHSSGSDVFFRQLNQGNFPTQGLSYLVGYVGNVATFVGADAAVHVSTYRTENDMFFSLMACRCPRKSRTHRSMSPAPWF